eukprot:1156420-Pelagomonas_calceolata.AAC.4
MDCPALQTARRRECSDVNVAGNLLVDIAAAYGLVFTTDRVHGDVGQPTFFGYRSDNRACKRKLVVRSLTPQTMAVLRYGLFLLGKLDYGKWLSCACLSKKNTKKLTRRARRAHEGYQKAVFLDRLQRHRPDIHELLRKPKSTHQTPITAEGWSSYLQRHFGVCVSNCSPSSNKATMHTDGMGSCPESTNYQEAALHTTVPVGGHPTCPAGSVPHIPHQQPGPMGSCPESTSSRRHGLFDSISRGVGSVLGAVRGVAQRVAAC